MQGRFMRKFAAILLILASGLVIGWCSGQSLQRSPAGPRPVTPRDPLPAAERAVIERFREARGSVVYLTSMSYQQDLFSLDVQTVPTGTGSGFIWDAEGHIATLRFEERPTPHAGIIQKIHNQVLIVQSGPNIETWNLKETTLLDGVTQSDLKAGDEIGVKLYKNHNLATLRVVKTGVPIK